MQVSDASVTSTVTHTKYILIAVQVEWLVPVHALHCLYAGSSPVEWNSDQT